VKADLNKRHEYDVFTRIKRGNDLTHVGTVEAKTDDLAKTYAGYVYDEEDWVEMYVVRRDNMVCVRLPEGLFLKEGMGLHG
jgi:1,2-phenylacetyl-CoA epoxidase PaaB subunit